MATIYGNVLVHYHTIVFNASIFITHTFIFYFCSRYINSQFSGCNDRVLRVAKAKSPCFKYWLW